MSKIEASNFDPRVVLAQAALGAISKDPAFTARFGGGEEADPPKAEDRAPADPAAPEAEEETPEASDTAVPPNDLEARMAKIEKMAEDRQTFISQLQRENAELRAKLEAPASPEPDVEAEDPFAELEQYGVPPETIRKAVLAGAKEVVQAYFAPMVQVAEAEKALSADPIYNEHAPKLEAFVRENKAIADTVLALANAGRIKEAKQYAWDSYKHAKAAEIEAPKRAEAAASSAARQAAKKDAGIAPTQKAESRTPKDDKGEINAQNLAAAQRTGSAKDIGRYIAQSLFTKPQ